MNLFTNFATLVFWILTRCRGTYSGTADPATSEKLTDKNKEFEISKMLGLPRPF